MKEFNDKFEEVLNLLPDRYDVKIFQKSKHWISISRFAKELSYFLVK